MLKLTIRDDGRGLAEPPLGGIGLLSMQARAAEVGGPAAPVWNDPAVAATDPAIEAELERLKERVAATVRNEAAAAPETTQAQA